MTLEIIPKGQKGNVFTVRPSEKITNPDGTTTIQDQSFIGYSAVKMIFRDPQGVEKKYTATYIPKAGLVNLKGVRIDQEPPIDDTNINDGNDGTERDGHRNEINSSPVNIGSLDSYIEVAGGVELELNRSTSGDVIGGFVIFFNEAVEGVFELVLYDQRGVNIVRTVPFSNPVRGINYIIDDVEDQIYINRIVIRNKGTNTARVAGFYSAVATPGILPYNYGYATAFLQVPGIDRPFTYVSIDKGKSLILKRDVVQESNTNHKVIFYVRGAAEPDLTIDFYKNSILQGTEVAVYDQESQTCTVPLNFEFDELHINVLDTTNGFGINLGGVSIENNDLVQMKDWTSAIISEPAIFPFDSKIETDVSVTQGTWFLESVGIKTVQRVIISDPNNEANSEIRVQVYVDNAWLTIHTGSIEAGAGIITLEINDIARTFDHFRLLSSKTFRVHEIVISGTAFTDLTGGSVVFHDNTGILDKYGTWSYRTNTIYKDQSNLESVNSSQVFVK